MNRWTKCGVYAWTSLARRGPSQVGKGQFERVLEMTGKVRDMGMEVCATLGEDASVNVFRVFVTV